MSAPRLTIASAWLALKRLGPRAGFPDDPDVARPRLKPIHRRLDLGGRPLRRPELAELLDLAATLQVEQSRACPGRIQACGLGDPARRVRSGWHRAQRADQAILVLGRLGAGLRLPRLRG